MTRHRELVPRPIIGEQAAVEQALATAARRGVLVHHDPALPLNDGRVLVHAVLRAPVRRRPWRVVGLAVVGLGVAGVVGAVVWLVVAYWATILGALAVLLIGLALAGRAGVCPGIHCPGCPHR